MVLDEQKKFCISCNANITINDDYCSRCGFKQSRRLEVSEQGAEKQRKKQKKPRNWIVIVAIFIASFFGTFIAFTTQDNSNQYVNKSSSDPNTLKGGQRVPKDVLPSLRGYIKLHGYSCSSIDRATVLNLKHGYSVWCKNEHGQLAYHYEVVDKGGNWVVTLK